MGGPTGFVLAEMQRQQANALRWGEVIAVDHQARRCKVKTAGVETDWLPYPDAGAGGASSSHPIKTGQQVMLAAPMGELAKAAIIAQFPSSKNPSFTDSGAIFGKKYADGSVIYYDEENSELLADLVDTTLTANREQVSVQRDQADFTMTGEGIAAQVGSASATVQDGEITLTVGEHTLTINETGIWHNGKNIGRSHRHSGVTPGEGDTGPVN